MERTFQIVFIRIWYANWKRISLIHCKKIMQITFDFVKKSFTRMVTWYISLKFLPWICGWPTNHRTGFRIRCSDRSVNFKSRDKPDILQGLKQILWLLCENSNALYWVNVPETNWVTGQHGFFLLLSTISDTFVIHNCYEQKTALFGLKNRQKGR